MEKEKMQSTLEKIIEKAAWKKISSEVRLNPEMIEQHSQKIDWAALSENDEMCWTAELVEKYQENLDFLAMSRNLFDDRQKLDWEKHLEIVRRFPKMLDWKELSQSELPSSNELFKEFAEYWDWEEISDNRKINWTLAFYEEHKDKLLSVLAGAVFDSMVENKKSIFYRRRNGLDNYLLDFLVKKKANKLTLSLLKHFDTEVETTENLRRGFTIEEYLNQTLE